MVDRPSIYVVSAPSGAGKTTLNRRLVREHPEVEMSVSYTTRECRATETDGVDYHFVSREEFERLITEGKMLEFAEVFGTLYGTSLKEIERIHQAGKKALLEIDVQGWEKARPKLPEAVSVFVLPPSVEALWRRLESRGTEPLEARWRRLQTARSEIEKGSLYQYFIINDDVERAYLALADLVIHGKYDKISNENGAEHCDRLLREFSDSPLLQKLSRDFSDKG